MTCNYAATETAAKNVLKLRLTINSAIAWLLVLLIPYCTLSHTSNYTNYHYSNSQSVIDSPAEHLYTEGEDDARGVGEIGIITAS